MSGKSFSRIVLLLFAVAVVLGGLTLVRIYRERRGVPNGEATIDLRGASENYRERISNTRELFLIESPYGTREAF